MDGLLIYTIFGNMIPRLTNGKRLEYVNPYQKIAQMDLLQLSMIKKQISLLHLTVMAGDMNPNPSPPARCGQGLAYDQESDRIIMFGGFGCKGVNDSVYNDTWSYNYNLNSWTKMNPDISPSARMYFAITYDPSNDIR